LSCTTTCVRFRSNVFLAKNNLVRLGDFGIARVLEHTFDQAKTVVGTPYYMSPEVCENKGYDERSDIWALGCVLYEMCTLVHAFQSDNLLGLVYKIVQERQPPLPEHYSVELRALVDRLLSKDPNARPDAVEILAMPFIAERLERLALQEGSTAGRSKPLMRMPSASPADIEAEATAKGRGGGRGGGAAAGSAAATAASQPTGGDVDPSAPSAPPTSAAAGTSRRGSDVPAKGKAAPPQQPQQFDDTASEPSASLISPAPTPVPRPKLGSGVPGGPGGSPALGSYAFLSQPAQGQQQGGSAAVFTEDPGCMPTPSRLHLPGAALPRVGGGGGGGAAPTVMISPVSGAWRLGPQGAADNYLNSLHHHRDPFQPSHNPLCLTRSCCFCSCCS
jgi:serine/threonine protein kinase